MRYLIPIYFLFCISKKAYCQLDTTLSKYSYLLVGIKTVRDSTKTIFPIGTCFFARRGNELFMITAKHCLNGYNTFNLKPTESQFDTVGFRYFDPHTQKISYSSLNIKDLKKYLSNDFFFNSPDAVVLKMNDPIVNPLIYSMESFMAENIYKNEKPDSIISFGFAFKQPHSFSDTTTSTYYSGFHQNNKDPYYPVNDSLYYVTQPISIQGMSGSPVFFKYIKSNKSYLAFGGVLFGADTPYNSSYIVNPAIIKQQVTNFLSPPQ